MKKVFFLLLLLLSFPFVLGEYENVVEGTANLVEGADLYYKIPDVVYEGSPFEIVVVLQPKEVLGDIELNLFKDGKLLDINATGEVLSVNEAMMNVYTWEQTLFEDAEYRIRFTKEDYSWRSTESTIEVRDKVIVNRQLNEEIYLPTEQTDNQRENFINLMAEQGIDYTLEQFNKEEQAAKELLSYDKKIYVETLVYNDNSTENRTVVVIDVEADESLGEVKIIESIPKDFAFHVDELFFNVEPIVLEEDPIVMWHLEDVDEQRIQYSVDGEATLTGNTILLTSVIEEQEEIVEEESSNSSKALLPLLLIPVIAAILIFFSKFSQPSKKRRR